ncbi:MAG: hypothetical protein GOVbin7368_48 [Prokaryotic dsDNA virus sp.]|nr:MAG: hypothetical protein GOVbin7368_48 [Prokaryotic dsDNA virus sp.]
MGPDTIYISWDHLDTFERASGVGRYELTPSKIERMFVKSACAAAFRAEQQAIDGNRAMNALKKAVKALER